MGGSACLMASDAACSARPLLAASSTPAPCAARPHPRRAACCRSSLAAPQDAAIHTVLWLVMQGPGRRGVGGGAQPCRPREQGALGTGGRRAPCAAPPCGRARRRAGARACRPIWTRCAGRRPARPHPAPPRTAGPRRRPAAQAPRRRRLAPPGPPAREAALPGAGAWGP